MQEQTTTPASWAWPRLEPVRMAHGLLLAGAIVTGVLFDLAVRSGIAALGAAAVVWSMVATVVAVRQTRNPWAIGCFAVAAALAACLVLRASPWLALPNLLAIALLLAVGSLLGEDGNPLDLRWSTLFVRSVTLLLRLVWVPGWLLRPLADLIGRVTGRQRSDAVAALRGAAIAIPLVLLFGVLLGSADPVFASFFNANFLPDPGDVILHSFLIAAGTFLLAGVAAGLSIRYATPPAVRERRGGREALVVMVVIDALFALFAVAQVVTAEGGGADAIRSAGITYADYARSGFFQLLWVAALTWLVVLAVRGTLPAERRPLRAALIASIEVAIGLVLLIVSVAHSRLQLYEAAYGFTMLRLYSHVFGVLAVGAFVLLGLAVAGVGSGRNWLFGAVTALGLAVLLGLNAANPEAIVVRWNVDRAHQTGKLDVSYLAYLSGDAMPLVLSAAPGLSSDERNELRSYVCNDWQIPTEWEEYDVANATSLKARQRYCAH